MLSATAIQQEVAAEINDHLSGLGFDGMEILLHDVERVALGDTAEVDAGSVVPKLHGGAGDHELI